MNCPWHPNKRAIASCKDCGTDFCIECVRETDQTTLCPDCFRRKINAIAKEFTEPADVQEEARPTAPKHEPAAKAEERVDEEPTLFDEEAATAAPRAAAPAGKKRGLRDKVGRKKGAGKTPPQPVAAPPLSSQEAAKAKPPHAEPPAISREEATAAAPREAASSEATKATPRAAAPAREKKRFGRKDKSRRKKEEGTVPPPPSGDFLAQGPDDDFSQLEADSGKPGRWSRGAKKAAETGAAESGEAVRAGEGDAGKPEAEEKEEPLTTKTAPMKPEREKAYPEEARHEPAPEKVSTSDDDLLQDVMSTLLTPEAGSAGAKAAATPEAVTTEAPVKAGGGKKAAKARAREARLQKKEARALEKKAKPAKERDLERWSFLAQPRSSELTLIAVSWWRAAIFIFLVLIGGALAWSLVNAYIIPRDMEYGGFAIVIGIAIGLVFWWKAGKKHSTKLAVQAALVTFFVLVIGEILHWFFIVLKNAALRTIVFDLVTFQFLWENWSEIMKYVTEAMFPAGFIYLIMLPTLVAFLIGFGLPPIPEVFVQFWRALRGKAADEKEATRGLEG